MFDECRHEIIIEVKIYWVIAKTFHTWRWRFDFINKKWIECHCNVSSQMKKKKAQQKMHLYLHSDWFKNKRSRDFIHYSFGKKKQWPRERCCKNDDEYSFDYTCFEWFNMLRCAQLTCSKRLIQIMLSSRICMFHEKKDGQKNWQHKYLYYCGWKFWFTYTKLYFDNISDQKVIHHTQAKERIICKNHLEFHHFFLAFVLLLSSVFASD